MSAPISLHLSKGVYQRHECEDKNNITCHNEFDDLNHLKISLLHYHLIYIKLIMILFKYGINKAIGGRGKA